MGRGRGKGKKQYTISHVGAVEDEKLSARRRGRPLKLMKDETDVEMEGEKLQDDDDSGDGENNKISVLSKSSKSGAGADSSWKRKMHSLNKENTELGIEENSIVPKNNAAILMKSIVYGRNGSIRKNKTRRAAEVGVKGK